MKKISISVGILTILALSGIFFALNKSKLNLKQYTPRSKFYYAKDANGYVEYLRMIRANPATGTINPKDVEKAYQEVLSLSQKKGMTLNIQWEEMGPDNVGGRTRAILIDKNNPNLMYAGGVSGGLFVSTNGGGSWTPYNNQMENLAISAITQTINGDIFVATGPGFDQPYGTGTSGFIGRGIFKITGNGNYVNVVGPNNNNSSSEQWAIINQIVADPINPNRLYAATQKGLMVSDDLGAIWFNPIHVVSGDPGTPNLQTSCQDIAIASNGTVYVSIGGALIYRSSSGNDATFEKLNGNKPGLYTSSSRAVIAISPDDPNVVYVAATKSSGALTGIYMSNDGGENWYVIAPGGGSFDPFCQVDGSACQGWYDMAMAVYPGNPGKILVGGVQLYKWEQTQSNPPFGQWSLAAVLGPDFPSNDYYVHPDVHTIRFKDANTVFVGTDGGIFRSEDGGETWRAMNAGYNVTQFYSVAFANNGFVMGGTQDNGTQVNVFSGNTPLSFVQILGGDGFDCDISQMSPPIAFASIYNGSINRFDGGNFSDISPCGSLGGPFHTVLRLWESYSTPVTYDSVPVPIDSFIPAGQIINYTSNIGSIPLSGTYPTDLNPGDTVMMPDPVQAKLAMFCGNSTVFISKNPLDLSNSPVWYQLPWSFPYALCFEFSKDGNHLFIGTATGGLYRVSGLLYAYNANTFQDINNGGVLSSSTIGNFNQAVTGIAIDPNNAENAVVTLGNYGKSNYVYRSTNAVSATNSSNAGWVSIQGDLPKMPVYDAIIDDSNNNIVILGTEFGAFATENAFAANPASVSWIEANTGMARVPVFALRQQTLPFVYASNTQMVYAGTHGRGIFNTRSLVTSINELSKNDINDFNNISIYPNPVFNKGIIDFTLNSSERIVISIYDLAGKQILRKDLGKIDKGKHNFEFYTTSFKNGSYFAIVSNGYSKQSVKFIVNK